MGRILKQAAKSRNKEKDFKKKTSKVGKHVAKGNVTKISVKSKRIDVPLQSSLIEERATGDELLRKLLKQLSHYQDNSREAALSQIAAFLEEAGNSSVQYISLIVPNALELLFDVQSTTRKELLSFMSSVLGKYSADAFQSIFSLFVTYICSGMTSLNRGIRRDSLTLLILVCESNPTLLAPYLEKLAVHILDLLIDPSHMNGQDSLHTNKTLSAQASEKRSSGSGSQSSHAGKSSAKVATTSNLVMRSLHALSSLVGTQMYKEGQTQDKSMLGTALTCDHKNITPYHASYGILIRKSVRRNSLLSTNSAHLDDSDGGIGNGYRCVMSSNVRSSICTRLKTLWQGFVIDSAAVTTEVLAALREIIGAAEIVVHDSAVMALSLSSSTASSSISAYTAIAESAIVDDMLGDFFSGFPYHSAEAAVAIPGSTQEIAYNSAVSSFNLSLCKVALIAAPAAASQGIRLVSLQHILKSLQSLSSSSYASDENIHDDDNFETRREARTKKRLGGFRLDGADASSAGLLFECVRRAAILMNQVSITSTDDTVHDKGQGHVNAADFFTKILQSLGDILISFLQRRREQIEEMGVGAKTSAKLLLFLQGIFDTLRIVAIEISPMWINEFECAGTNDSRNDVLSTSQSASAIAANKFVLIATLTHACELFHSFLVTQLQPPMLMPFLDTLSATLLATLRSIRFEDYSLSAQPDATAKAGAVLRLSSNIASFFRLSHTSSSNSHRYHGSAVGSVYLQCGDAVQSKIQLLNLFYYVAVPPAEMSEIMNLIAENLTAYPEYNVSDYECRYFLRLLFDRRKAVNLDDFMDVLITMLDHSCEAIAKRFVTTADSAPLLPPLPTWWVAVGVGEVFAFSSRSESPWKMAVAVITQIHEFLGDDEEEEELAEREMAEEGGGAEGREQGNKGSTGKAAVAALKALLVEDYLRFASVAAVLTQLLRCWLEPSPSNDDDIINATNPQGIDVQGRVYGIIAEVIKRAVEKVIRAQISGFSFAEDLFTRDFIVPFSDALCFDGSPPARYPIALTFINTIRSSIESSDDDGSSSFSSLSIDLLEGLFAALRALILGGAQEAFQAHRKTVLEVVKSVEALSTRLNSLCLDIKDLI